MESNYDLESVQDIFLGGDGASWMKQGLEILPKSIFVLDCFHLVKCIREVLHHDTLVEQKLWKAIQEGLGKDEKQFSFKTFP